MNRTKNKDTVYNNFFYPNPIFRTQLSRYLNPLHNLSLEEPSARTTSPSVVSSRRFLRILTKFPSYPYEDSFVTSRSLRRPADARDEMIADAILFSSNKPKWSPRTNEQNIHREQTARNVTVRHCNLTG